MSVGCDIDFTILISMLKVNQITTFNNSRHQKSAPNNSEKIKHNICYPVGLLSECNSIYFFFFFFYREKVLAISFPVNPT